MRRLALLPPALVVVIAACGSSPTRTATTPAATAAAAPRAPSVSLADAGVDPTWLDTTADPCQDFFAYACGGFVKTATIPPDRPTWGATEMLEKEIQDLLHDTLDKAAASPGGDPVLQKIGDYYAACMDEPGIDKAGLAPVQPLLDIAAHVTDFASLADAVTKLHAAAVPALFSTSSTQDYADATLIIAGLDQGGIGLPDRDYYLDDTPDAKSTRDFYAAHVGRTFALTGMKGDEAKTAVDDVMRIETKIAHLEQDKVSRRDPHKVYHRVERDGLAKAAKTFPWDAYFTTLGLGSVRAITVNDPAYFEGIDALMHEEKPTAFRHYLAWRVLQAESPRLSKPFLDEWFALRKQLTGQEVLPPRWKQCVRATDGELGELLAQPFLAARFAGDSKARAQAVVTSIHEAMRAELESLAWMDDATRAAAIKKLDAIHDKVGYPDRWRTYDFDVTRASYAANALASDRFEVRRDLAKIGKPLDRNDWIMTPPTVNAYYDPSLNEIVLPAGQLQPPFFSRTFYTPVNLGEIGGNTIGHEITHAFDDQGSQFDGDGNLRNWWTDTTKAKFDASTKCVQAQYGGYDAIPGTKLNGELTSGENIADIGGVKLAYAALKSWQKAHPEEERTVEGFSDEQLLFLGYAQGWCGVERPAYRAVLVHSDPHSPPRLRVNGPMVDVPAFADAFRCKAGTPMNPGHVCSVW